MKTLAILTKNYALFYLHPDNIHPSIIPNQGYHFIDDPRIFQKYAGYNFQKEHPIWIKSIDDTWSQRVLYQDNLVLLPYYHCNAGFTRSAKEQFGWIDTAYLSSILDSDGKCEDHTFQ